MSTSIVLILAYQLFLINALNISAVVYILLLFTLLLPAVALQTFIQKPSYQGAGSLECTGAETLSGFW